MNIGWIIGKIFVELIMDPNSRSQWWVKFHWFDIVEMKNKCAIGENYGNVLDNPGLIKKFRVI